MSQACPLLFRQIDGTVVRINALWVTLLVIIFLTTSQTFWLYLLVADFMVRLYGSKAYSPINRLSMFVKKMMRFETHMTDAGAKRLAAHFGVLFSVLLIAAHHLGMEKVTYVLAALFILCAALEVLFNYCVGCKIYYISKKIFPGR